MQVTQSTAPDKRVYEVTAAGRDAVAAWLLDASWPKVAQLAYE